MTTFWEVWIDGAFRAAFLSERRAWIYLAPFLEQGCVGFVKPRVWA